MLIVLILLSLILAFNVWVIGFMRSSQTIKITSVIVFILLIIASILTNQFVGRI
jgi:hypothetical protein